MVLTLVLAFLCGWVRVEGLCDLDDALEVDGLLAREVRLGDGSSPACSGDGGGLGLRGSGLGCVLFPLSLPLVPFFFLPTILK